MQQSRFEQRRNGRNNKHCELLKARFLTMQRTIKSLWKAAYCLSTDNQWWRNFLINFEISLQSDKFYRFRNSRSQMNFSSRVSEVIRRSETRAFLVPPPISRIVHRVLNFRFSPLQRTSRVSETIFRAGFEYFTELFLFISFIM